MPYLDFNSHNILIVGMRLHGSDSYLKELVQDTTKSQTQDNQRVIASE
jgi:hypothetical protein